MESKYGSGEKVREKGRRGIERQRDSKSEQGVREEERKMYTFNCYKWGFQWLT